MAGATYRAAHKNGIGRDMKQCRGGISARDASTNMANEVYFNQLPIWWHATLVGGSFWANHFWLTQFHK